MWQTDSKRGREGSENMGRYIENTEVSCLYKCKDTSHAVCTSLNPPAEARGKGKGWLLTISTGILCSRHLCSSVKPVAVLQTSHRSSVGRDSEGRQRYRELRFPCWKNYLAFWVCSWTNQKPVVLEMGKLRSNSWKAGASPSVGI